MRPDAENVFVDDAESEAWAVPSTGARASPGLPKAALLGSSSSAPQLRSSDARQVWVDTSCALFGEELSPQNALAAGARQAAPISSPISRPPSRQVRSRPGTSGSMGSSPGSRPGSRSSGRFSPEELQCFRRVPTPSHGFDPKSEVCWSSTGDPRGQSLPTLKNKLFSGSLDKETSGHRDRKALASPQGRRGAILNSEEKQLPAEAFTAAVLNQIFPRHVGKNDVKEAELTLDEPTASKRYSALVLGRRMTSVLLTVATPEFALGPSAGRAGEAGFQRSPTRRIPRSSTTGAIGSTIKETTAGGSQILSLGGTLNSTALAGSVAAITGTGGSAPSGRPVASNTQMMLGFRQRLIEKFVTIKEAYEAFVATARGSRQLSKKEWLRLLAKFGFEWQSREECTAIMDLLDIRSDGHFSPSELYIAVEAVVPVRTLENLRRRWLATGYNSMLQALRSLGDSGHITSQRHGFAEFAELLKKVNVPDYAEHFAIFTCVCDDFNGRQTASVADLACAIATVSPHLLLEDLRERLLRRYGSFEKAFLDADLNNNCAMDYDEFMAVALKRLGLTEYEAKTMFREMDIDCSGEISYAEFFSAISLTEPSLFLEDLRRKVRQRFQSIKEVFLVAFSHNLTDKLSEAKLAVEHFQEMLRPLSMKDSETRALFSIIDTDCTSELTIREFVKGVHHFAPSAILEEVRLRCFQSHQQVMDAFAPIAPEDRHRLLDLEVFSRILGDLNLLEKGRDHPTGGFQVQAVFDLIDVQHNGMVSIGRLMAGLRTCGAGIATKLPSEDLNFRAKMDIRSDMLPLSRMVHDIKTQVRAGMHWEEHRPRSAFGGMHDFAHEIRGDAGLSMTDQMIEGFEAEAENPKRNSVRFAVRNSRGKGVGGLKGNDGKGPVSQELETDSKKSRLPNGRGDNSKRPTQLAAAGTQQSWSKVLKNLQRLPEDEQRAVLELNLEGYFEAAKGQLSRDVSVIGVSAASRHALHKSVRTHESALKRRQ